jgi:hypothetical protein
LPCVYLIDARGIIRYKQVEGKGLDEAIERLLQETKTP